MVFPGPDAFDGGPHRHRMGVRWIDESEWIDVDEGFPNQTRLKLQLLAEHRSQVLARLEDERKDRVDRASVALLDTIVGALQTYHPEAFRLVAERLDLDEPPIARCGLLTQEDWVVLLPEAGRLIVGAASVSFPTRWDLPSKLGLPVLGVHEPVEGYADEIGARVDRYLLGLPEGRVSVRLNWNLVDEDRLHQPRASWPGPGPNPAVTATNAGERVWLRVERETMRRIGEAVVFGIRVHQQTVAEVATDPARLQRLVDSVRALPEATAAYKGLPAFGDAFLGWALDRPGIT